MGAQAWAGSFALSWFCSDMGGGGSGWKLQSGLGQQACCSTRLLPFHMDFLGMTGASVQFLFPAARSRQAQGDKTSLNVVGQGTIWGGRRRATGSVAGTAGELASGLGVTQGLVT